MGKTQASKMSRRARKEAKFAGLPKNTGHPSHVSNKRWKHHKKFKWRCINTSSGALLLFFDGDNPDTM